LTVQEFDQLASDEKEKIMKTLWTTLFSGLMICGVLLAQETTPSQKDGTAAHEQDRATNSNTQGASEQPGSQQRQVPQEGGNAQSQTTSEQTSAGLRIAPGSIIPVQLTKTIDAKKVKTGDEVEAKVTQDLTTGNGEVVLPKDTKVVGHVTEAQTRSKEQKESQIGIAFDHIVGKNRDTVQLPMSIQAIIAPPSLNSGNHSVAGESAGLPASAQTPGGMSPGNSSGRSTGMGTGTPHQAPSPSTAGGQESASTQTSTDVRQPITGNTQGVVGISNLQLAMAANSAQGSVVSSEKSNVKLESGTLMLLRVNQ
jgi:hypothetical protein